jgi:hypothetical protein
VKAVEVAVAEVALVAGPVPRARRGLIRHRAIPLDQFVGYEPVRIFRKHIAVYGLAAGGGIGAGVHLEVVSEAGSRGEVLAALGTDNATASVASRVEMLRVSETCSFFFFQVLFS